MNILLIGSGGREHALAWKLARSPRLTKLYAAPGNPGIAQAAELVALDVADHQSVIAFCRKADVGFVVIGPEVPLVAGIVDDLAEAGIATFGPDRAAARLEASKAFTKELCAEANIPTAAWRRFTDAAAAEAYIRTHGAPVVVKADGLAAGKGVTVATTLDEALEAAADCFAGAHGGAGAEVVIEDLLVGEEASFFALSDGANVIPFGTAEDHKRVGDGDTGPNTGGMGAVSPSGAITPPLAQRVMTEIIRPTVAAMAQRGTPFRGVLYAGLMLTAEGPKLIEYNVRFGDPEAQVLMPRLESDLLDLMLASSEGRLARVSPRWSDRAALTVVMAAKGYPGAYSRGGAVVGIESAEAMRDVAVFQAGTALRDGRLVANGGRVLDVTALGNTLAEAQAEAYAAVARIDFADGFCRRDIGDRAVARERRPGPH